MVTSGVFHQKVSVFSGLEASGEPTAIEPEFEFRRGRWLPVVDSFRTFAMCPPSALKVPFSKINNLWLSEGS